MRIRATMVAAALVAMFGAMLLAMTGPAAAQSSEPRDPPTTDTRPPENIFNQMDAGRLTTNQYRTSEMVGLPIYSSDGEQIGEVDDVVIDTAEGRIDMVVLATGGFLGLGENRFGINWSEIAFDQQKKRLTLSLTSEEVRTAAPLRGRN